MDEREDLQNVEDNIVAENIDTSLEEQIKAPPIEIHINFIKFIKNVFTNLIFILVIFNCFINIY